MLGGHAHNYERFAPQNPAGKLDTARGIRQFVVGTGGAFFTNLSTTKPNSEVRNASTYGVLMLTLHPNSLRLAVRARGRQELHRLRQRAVSRCRAAPPAESPGGALAAEVDPPKVAVAKGQPAVSCTIVGTAGPDVLAGTPDADVICGLGGDDRLSAGGGYDVVSGGAGRDRIRGGDGDDDLLGGRGRDALFGGRGNDVLRGNFASDRLYGQSGNDRIIGGGGRNRLYGNSGNDVLIASLNRRGVDRVYGGRGRDRARVDRGDRVRSALPRVR